MTALASYSTGTVSVAAGGTTVTGSGTIWSGTNVKPGDILQIGNFQSVISDVTDTTHLVIPPWGGGAQSAVAYKIWQVSPQRFAGATAMQTVNDLVAALNVSGFFWFVATGATAPDPSYGNDGQYAFQPSTGAYWLKSGGVWVSSGSPAAGYGGTSTTSLAIGTGAKAFTTQTGLAYNGARVRASAASDATKWMEGVASYSGATLTITVDKVGGSGTFASWTFAIAGQPGIGDLVSTNNLSDLASKIAAMDNLSVHGADIAAAATLNLDTATGNFVHVTGNTTITAITLTDGRQRTVLFTGTPLLTNGASLVLPGGGNIQVGAGDIAVFVADGSVVRCSDYLPATQAQARAVVYAAPFDALATNGLQVNGSMEVSQEKGTAATTTNSSYVIDGWQLHVAGSMAVSAQQVTDAPSGFNNSIKVTVTTAAASLGATDSVTLYTPIEGFRTSRLGFGKASPQPVSIGFWSKIHRTGSYSGVIKNATSNRSCPFTFTQNVADTWEYKTVTLAGDSAGTWVGNSNGVGLYLAFAMAVGSSMAGTSGTWAASNLDGATGSTNGAAATSDSFQITGVVVLPGIELPSSARSALIMRPYDQETLLCLRYYEKTYDDTTTPGSVSGVTALYQRLNGLPTSTHTYRFTWQFKTRKRANPTMTWYSPNTGAAGKVRDETANADATATIILATYGHATVEATLSSSSEANMLFHAVADARL